MSHHRTYTTVTVRHSEDSEVQTFRFNPTQHRIKLEALDITDGSSDFVLYLEAKIPNMVSPSRSSSPTLPTKNTTDVLKYPKLDMPVNATSGNTSADRMSIADDGCLYCSPKSECICNETTPLHTASRPTSRPVPSQPQRVQPVVPQYRPTNMAFPTSDRVPIHLRGRPLNPIYSPLPTPTRSVKKSYVPQPPSREPTEVVKPRWIQELEDVASHRYPYPGPVTSLPSTSLESMYQTQNAEPKAKNLGDIPLRILALPLPGMSRAAVSTVIPTARPSTDRPPTCPVPMNPTRSAGSRATNSGHLPAHMPANLPPSVSRAAESTAMHAAIRSGSRPTMPPPVPLQARIAKHHAMYGPRFSPYGGRGHDVREYDEDDIPALVPAPRHTNTPPGIPVAPVPAVPRPANPPPAVPPPAVLLAPAAPLAPATRPIMPGAWPPAVNRRKLARTDNDGNSEEQTAQKVSESESYSDDESGSDEDDLSELEPNDEENEYHEYDDSEENDDDDDDSGEDADEEGDEENTKSPDLALECRRLWDDAWEGYQILRSRQPVGRASRAGENADEEGATSLGEGLESRRLWDEAWEEYQLLRSRHPVGRMLCAKDVLVPETEHPVGFTWRGHGRTASRVQKPADFALRGGDETAADGLGREKGYEYVDEKAEDGDEEGEESGEEDDWIDAGDEFMEGEGGKRVMTMEDF